MVTYLYIEIDIIGIILLTFIFFDRKHLAVQPRDQIYLDYILFAVAVMHLFDILKWVVDGKSGNFVFIIYTFFSLIYNIFIPLFGFIWFMFCYYNTRKSAKVKALMFCLLALPVALNAVGMIFSLYNNSMFYIDSDNVYHRGKLFFLCVALSLAYILAASVLCIIKAAKTTNPIKARDYALLGFVSALPVVGGVVYMLYYEVPLFWAFTALALLIIHLNAQNHLISIDLLTGTNNRWQLNRYIEQKTKNMNDDHMLFVFMIDIDNFKSINDNLGHDVGDKAIIESADILKSVCSGTHDFLARLGGDEFVIVAERQCEESAESIKWDILKAVDRFNTNNDRAYMLSFSVGFSGMSAEDAKTKADEILIKADSDMYAVKGKKRSVKSAVYSRINRG